MNLMLRKENERDFAAVEYLTREAFWDIYKPGCDEHLLAHKLRATPAFIPELDFVAQLGDKIVGNIMYSKARLIDANEKEEELITFGPVSVLPEFQKAGIGSMLINHTKKLAKEMGWRAIVIFGNPLFYHRFGFVNAKEYNISTSEGENFEAFMVLELFEDALRDISGKFFEDPVFKTDHAELEAFEKNFPYREKHVTDTQLK